MVMLTTVDLSHSSVLAQDTTSTPDTASTPDSMPIIPTPETSSGDDDESPSSEDSEEPSSEDSDDSDAQEDISSNEEGEEADETEDDYTTTNPFREQIRERVFGAFNVSGIVFP
jgi:hypothetical protein